MNSSKEDCDLFFLSVLIKVGCVKVLEPKYSEMFWHPERSLNEEKEKKNEGKKT